MSAQGKRSVALGSNHPYLIPAPKGNAVKHFRSCIRQNAGLWAFPIRVLANAATHDSRNSLEKMLHSVAQRGGPNRVVRRQRDDGLSTREIGPPLWGFTCDACAL